MNVFATHGRSLDWDEKPRGVGVGVPFGMALGYVMS